MLYLVGDLVGGLVVGALLVSALRTWQADRRRYAAYAAWLAAQRRQGRR